MNGPWMAMITIDILLYGVMNGDNRFYGTKYRPTVV